MTETVEQSLASASAIGAAVTLARTDGRTFVGVPVPDEHDPLTYSIRTGKRGRPARVHVDDVKSVARA